MASETPYCLRVNNLPERTNWQQIKDLVRRGDNESINIKRADVVEGTRIAWLWFSEYADLQRAYEFLKGKQDWKGSRLKVEKWTSGQAAHPNDGRLQDPFMYQINPSFPPFLYAPPPLLTNQFSALEPRNTPAYYNPPLPRSYPYRASPPYTTPASEYGSSGSAPGFNAACTSDSTTSDSLTPTPVFLTEPRGVHIGNVSLETSETATRRLVARTVQIQDDQIQDQIQDTLYQPHYSTASHSVSYSYPQHQSHYGESNTPQYDSWASDYPVETMTFGDGDLGDRAGQLSSANVEPEFIDPLVVDGSKNRDQPKSSSNGERSTKEKSKKNSTSDSKGKQKHKRH